jgi:citrate lyase beta subunit
MSAPRRLRRSGLAVPAANPRRIGEGAASDADLVCLDLEDAAAPVRGRRERYPMALSRSFQ